MSYLIDRQAVLEKVRTMQTYKLFEDIILVDKAEVQTELMMLPTVQPEPSIPLSWVEKHIEWLKGLDNEFANLAAAHISVMLNGEVNSMRLIDADVLKQHIDKLPALPDGNFAGNHSALKALINMQPTIEPSTNCSEFPNNSDTISRQAAIDAVNAMRFGMEKMAFEIITTKLLELPTIQPQSTAGQLNDSAQSTNLIDRQQAIGALAKQMPTPYTPDGSHPADEQIFQVQEVYADCITTIKLLPTIQPEPHEGHWIPHESPDGGVQYECSRCGVLWEFNDGTPEDNEAYFCPKCGAKMKGEANE